MVNFNPRSREGSDDQATLWDSRNHDFNPRSREGSDWNSSITLVAVKIFQSTLPRRERPFGTPDGRDKSPDFNPRSCEGSDLARGLQCSDLLHFNPRSREGSDATTSSDRIQISLFQSTLPRRERPLEQLKARESETISIHAPAKGATEFEPDQYQVIRISIHAPAKGATL